jgi:hypothetical protein
MSYAIQYYLHGPRPMPFHFVNWILHALASALVGQFAIKLAERCAIDVRRARAIGFISGLLFAVHPIHVEAIANVVGRAELMCAIGVVGAMLLFLSPLNRARVLGIYACFVLALLSKEQGMLLPLLLGVIAFTQRYSVGATLASTESKTVDEVGAASGSRARQASPLQTIEFQSGSTNFQFGPVLFAILAVTLAGYVSYRESILKFWWEKNFLDVWIQPLAAPGVTLADRVLVPVTIAGRYLQLLVSPVTLRLDYGGLIVPGKFDSSDPYFYVGLLAIVLWIALFALAIRQRDRFSVVCLLCFAFLYGLIGNVVTIIGVNMAERLMYLPSVFFVLIAARWLVRVDRRLALSIAGVVVALFALRSITYAARWNDKLGFYVYSATVEPRSVKSVQLSTLEFLEQNRLDEAEAYARRAISLRTEGDDVYLQLAGVLIRRGKWPEAEAAIGTARQLNPPGAWSAYQLKLDSARGQSAD